jgi:hypothetical protein
MPLLAATPKSSVSDALFRFVLRIPEINSCHQMLYQVSKLDKLKYHFIKSVQQFISHRTATTGAGQWLVNTNGLS